MVQNFQFPFSPTLFGEKQYNKKETIINLHGFADDHIMKKSFSISENNGNEFSTISDLEECISKVKEWMNHNRLKMNGEKTEFILYGSRQQLKKSVTNNINGYQWIEQTVLNTWESG